MCPAYPGFPHELSIDPGPHAARKYQFVARGIAEALVAVGAGSTYRDAALVARQRARRLRTDGVSCGRFTPCAGSPTKRSLLGPRARITSRFLALAAAISLNHQLGRPSRALVDYTA